MGLMNGNVLVVEFEHGYRCVADALGEFRILAISRGVGVSANVAA
jgi:hypothetical protein